MHDIVLVQVVERLVQSLDRVGIRWCVLRNYENFPRPRSDTSDLDLLVDCSAADALHNLKEAIKYPHIGIGRLFTKSDSTLLGVFITVPNSPTLHIDFLDKITWLGQALISTDVLLDKRKLVNNLPIPSSGHEAAVSLMSFLFHQGHVKEEYAQRLQYLLNQDHEGFLECLYPIWGERTAEELAERVAMGDWEWFVAWVRGAKRYLLLKAWRNPITALQNLKILAVNIARRILMPSGLWIAFLGPDGSGKTTVGDAYRTRLATLFYPARQRHLHWRPRWLPTPSQLVGGGEEDNLVTDPHLKAPHGQMVSFLRFFYFWLDFVVGYWIRVRPFLARAGLVTFDRYYHDFLVDPLRYRLNLPSWFILLMARWVPQPELIFVLDASAEVLHERKQELTLSEIEVQLVKLRDLATNNASVRIIQVDRDVNEIVDELERETLTYLDQRNRHRLGWGSLRVKVHGDFS